MRARRPRIGSPPAPTTCSSSAAASTAWRSPTRPASRGLRTALVEAADFGGGTSFNHQKTAHGGLRSLQSGRVDRALRLDPRAARAGAHRAVAAASAAVPGRHLPVADAQPCSRCAPPSSSTRWLGRHRNDRRRAGAAPAAGAAAVEGRHAEAVPGHPPGRPDRRRAVVRLPDRRGRPPDVRVRGGGGSQRGRPRQLCRGDRRGPRRRAA